MSFTSMLCNFHMFSLKSKTKTANLVKYTKLEKVKFAAFEVLRAGLKMLGIMCYFEVASTEMAKTNQLLSA